MESVREGEGEHALVSQSPTLDCLNSAYRVSMSSLVAAGRLRADCTQQPHTVRGIRCGCEDRRSNAPVEPGLGLGLGLGRAAQRGRARTAAATSKSS